MRALLIAIALLFPLPANTLACEKPKSVTMYSLPWCGQCKVAKRLLRSEGIRVLERHYLSRPASLAKYPGVPIFVVDGRVLYGSMAKARAAMCVG